MKNRKYDVQFKLVYYADAFTTLSKAAVNLHVLNSSSGVALTLSLEQLAAFNTKPKS